VHRVPLVQLAWPVHRVQWGPLARKVFRVQPARLVLQDQLALLVLRVCLERLVRQAQPDPQVLPVPLDLLAPPVLPGQGQFQPI